MGQDDVYNFLRTQRVTGNSEYFTPKQIAQAFKEQGKSNGCIYGIRGDLLKLEWFDLIEIKSPSDVRAWTRTYRYKLKKNEIKDDILKPAQQNKIR